MDDVCEKRECVLVVINSPYLQLRERERESGGAAATIIK